MSCTETKHTAQEIASENRNNVNNDSKQHPNSALFIASSAHRIAPVIGVLLQVGLAIVLAVTCKVGICDITFSITYSLYLIAANHVRFQNNFVARMRAATKNGHRDDGKIDLDLFSDQRKGMWFPIYMTVFTVLGLLLPLGTILMPGCPEDVRMAVAPHLFVLWCQIIMESVALNSIYFHGLIRIMVPIGFSIYRMRNLILWCDESREQLLSISGSSGDDKNESWFYYWSVGLACINLVIWTYNLFVVLLLRMVPYYMDPQKSPSPEVEWKGQLIPMIVRSASSSQLLGKKQE